MRRPDPPTCCLRGKVVLGSFEVGEQAGVSGLPSEPLLGEVAGGRTVEAGEGGEPAEMIAGFLDGFGDDGKAEAFSNKFCNVTEGDGFFGDAVIVSPRGTSLKHEAVEMPGVQPVHGGPTILPIAHISGDALFARDADENGDEAVIAVAVDGGGETDDRGADSTGRRGNCHLFRDARKVGHTDANIFFRSGAALGEESGPGGDDQGTIRTGKLVAESFDGFAVDLADTAGSWRSRE